jgi:signal transduction histidine kinase/CheY-like chemotaxis protein
MALAVFTGMVVVGLLSDAPSDTNDTAFVVGAVGVLGIVGTILLIWSDLVRSVLRPVTNVRTAAKRMRAGDFSTAVPVKGTAEMQALAASVNSMAHSLEAAQKELQRQRAELSSLRVEATSASQAKTDFLSRMSHELRTPLNAILGFAQLLEMDELDARQRDNVAHIVSGGRHLLDLINEVLEISRIETGSVNPVIEPVRVADSVREALELVGPLATQREIELKASLSAQEHVTVSADRQHLKQVLLNLIANGVKYNREGGSVTVEIAPGGDRVRVRVVDTGMGIPQDQLPKLFVPFERLGAEASGVEGTGLGLVLCKRLTEAMNGYLGVESQPWIGSTFWVDLPVAELADVAPVEAYPPRMAARGDSGTHSKPATAHRVLYIEDDPANTRLMAELLADEPSLELVTTMQGKLGLELARRHIPALVLLDLHLPDLDGTEIIRRLRTDPVTQDIPVIVVSADATEESRRRMTAYGAAGFLTKPLDLDLVLATIWEVLERPSGTPVFAPASGPQS